MNLFSQNGSVGRAVRLYREVRALHISTYAGYASFFIILAVFPALEAIRGTFVYRLLMIAFKLLLLPVVVGITYEINRWCGRNDNWFTRMLSFPGMWMQNFTTNEPDDSMIEVAIRAVEEVLPEQEGADRW